MRTLNYQLKLLGERNQDGSEATKANRARLLSLIANQLHELGYRKLEVHNLKGKHVQALVAHWQAQDLSPGTIKNRMAAIRWWAEKIGKKHILSNDNAHYGIPERHYVTNESKAQELGDAQLALVKEPYVRMSLEMQRAFGLRREEALKCQPSFSDQGDVLRLKGSWTKGGKERRVPIRTDEQREVLRRAHRLAGRGSLIPPNRSYVKAGAGVRTAHLAGGLHKLHGLRHAYAQNRYAELTGWLAPANGGPTSRQLSPAQKRRDREVRLTISQELGHEREQITATYLGR